MAPRLPTEAVPEASPKALVTEHSAGADPGRLGLPWREAMGLRQSTPLTMCWRQSDGPSRFSETPLG